MFIIKIILRWIGLSCAVWVASQIIPGIVVNPYWVAFIVGACLTVFNIFIKPILSLLTLPLNLLTFGLFSFVINSAIFWYMGKFVDGFTVDKFTTAFIGAIVVSIINWFLRKVFRLD